MPRDHRTGATYDAVAIDYDERFRDELDGKPRDRELLDALAARSTGPVLDVGSGPGHIGARIRAAGRRVIALDLSRTMADLAARRLDAAVVADMLHLPVASASITDVVAFYSLIHLPRARLIDGLREFARVLEPGGHALLSAHEGTDDVEVTEFLGHEVDLHATFFTLDELAEAAAVADLAVLLAERRPPYSHEGSTTRLHLELAKQAT